MVKRKLFLELRIRNRRDWENLVANVVQNLNQLRRKTLGGLRPVDLSSYTKATAIDKAIGFERESKFSEHKQNIADFHARTDLDVGDYVYISPNRPLRSFHIQVSKPL